MFLLDLLMIVWAYASNRWLYEIVRREDDTKLCQLQLSISKFPDAAQIFHMNSPVKFWLIRT